MLHQSDQITVQLSRGQKLISRSQATNEDKICKMIQTFSCARLDEKEVCYYVSK